MNPTPSGKPDPGKAERQEKSGLTRSSRRPSQSSQIAPSASTTAPSGTPVLSTPSGTPSGTPSSTPLMSPLASAQSSARPSVQANQQKPAFVPLAHPSFGSQPASSSSQPMRSQPHLSQLQTSHQQTLNQIISPPPSALLTPGSVLSPTATGDPLTRNVSFASDLNGQTAKYEHNPPAVLRRVEAAARKEQSPLTDVRSAATSRQTSRQVSQTNSRNNSHVASPSTTPPFGPVFTNPFTSSVNSLVMPPSVVQSTENLGISKQDEVHILVGCTGSVATLKLPLIVHKLKQLYKKRAIIQIVVTKTATHFFDPTDIPRDVKIWQDSDEWRSRIPYRQGEGVQYMDHQLHIKLRRWADVLLVAPCSANTLAKLTHGICDNLLTSTFRVWNPEVPVLLAPAMNTHMYTNPVTKSHFDILKKDFPFVQILKPVEKVLVCGDIGMGGMCEWTEIVQILVKKLGVPLEDSDSDSDDS